MKPDQEQIKTLQNYLNETLIYREAYEEVYDHILTALENQPAGDSFENMINTIIRTDFGIPKNLLVVENGIKEALVKETTRKYIGYFVSYFKFPSIIYTALFALFTYWFLSQMKFNVAVIVGITALVTFFPGIIYLMRLYYTGYILDTTKKSAKDKLFETLAGIPIRFMVVVFIIDNVVKNSW